MCFNTMPLTHPIQVVPLARRHCKMHQEEVEEEVAICEEAQIQDSIAHLSTAGKLLARLRGVRRRRDSRAALDTELTESKEVAAAKSTAKVSPPRKPNIRRGSEASAASPTDKVHSNVSKESPKAPKRRIPLGKISPAPTVRFMHVCVDFLLCLCYRRPLDSLLMSFLGFVVDMAIVSSWHCIVFRLDD